MANHPYNRWVGTFSRPWGEWRICNLQCSLQQSCTVCGSWDQVWDWVRWRRCDRYVVVVDTSLVSSHLVTRARYVQDNIVLALDLGFEQESENIRNLCREFILVTGGSSFTQLSTVHCPWGTYITNRVVRVRLWSTWHYFIEKKKKKKEKRKNKRKKGEKNCHSNSRYVTLHTYFAGVSTDPRSSHEQGQRPSTDRNKDKGRVLVWNCATPGRR